MDTPNLDEACRRVVCGQIVPPSMLTAAEVEVRQVAERFAELCDRIVIANHQHEGAHVD